MIFFELGLCPLDLYTVKTLPVLTRFQPPKRNINNLKVS